MNCLTKQKDVKNKPLLVPHPLLFKPFAVSTTDADAFEYRMRRREEWLSSVDITCCSCSNLPLPLSSILHSRSPLVWAPSKDGQGPIAAPDLFQSSNEVIILNHSSNVQSTREKLCASEILEKNNEFGQRALLLLEFHHQLLRETASV